MSPEWAAVTITFMVCVTLMVCVSMICAEIRLRQLDRAPDQAQGEIR